MLKFHEMIPDFRIRQCQEVIVNRISMRHHQSIFHRIGQRAPGGFDDVRACADSAPAFGAVPRIDQHACDGFGAVIAIQDADFVIGQMKCAICGYLRNQRLAQARHPGH